MNDRNTCPAAIAWNELPYYGARLLRAGIESLRKPVTVVATRPRAPFASLEEALGQPVVWMDSPQTVCTWETLGQPVPKLFIHTGWEQPAFVSLGREAKQNGGRVVGIVDNCWKGNLRQWLGAVYFRFNYRPLFDAVWVPGISGERLCRFFGMPENRIYTGLYGGDPETYTPGPPLSQRPQQFLFAGQLIRRKGIPVLIQAWKTFAAENPGWELHLYGEGPLAPQLEGIKGIRRHEFAQPSVLARAMAQSRFFVLPSLEDHWPLVVHEAGLCGCGFIVSDGVGNRFDLAGSQNGFVAARGSAEALAAALRSAAGLSGGELDAMGQRSLQAASRFGPRRFADALASIVTDLGPA